MIYKPTIGATALVVASCCFSAAAAAPAKEVRSAPVPAAAQADTPWAAYDRKDVPALTAMAEAGNAFAQYNLGSMYDNGRGVAQDYAAAASWYRKAADQGNAFAQSNLGVMYYNGKGVAQDYVQAHKWFNLGATSGDADAVKNRDIVASKMTPAQIAEAQRLASAWRKK